MAHHWRVGRQPPQQTSVQETLPQDTTSSKRPESETYEALTPDRRPASAKDDTTGTGQPGETSQGGDYEQEEYTTLQDVQNSSTVDDDVIYVNTDSGGETLDTVDLQTSTECEYQNVTTNNTTIGKKGKSQLKPLAESKRADISRNEVTKRKNDSSLNKSSLEPVTSNVRSICASKKVNNTAPAKLIVDPMFSNVSRKVAATNKDVSSPDKQVVEPELSTAASKMAPTSNRKIAKIQQLFDQDIKNIDKKSSTKIPESCSERAKLKNDQVSKHVKTKGRTADHKEHFKATQRMEPEYDNVPLICEIATSKDSLPDKQMGVPVLASATKRTKSNNDTKNLQTKTTEEPELFDVKQKIAALKNMENLQTKLTVEPFPTNSNLDPSCKESTESEGLGEPATNRGKVRDWVAAVNKTEWHDFSKEVLAEKSSETVISAERYVGLNELRGDGSNIEHIPSNTLRTLPKPAPGLSKHPRGPTRRLWGKILHFEIFIFITFLNKDIRKCEKANYVVGAFCFTQSTNDVTHFQIGCEFTDLSTDTSVISHIYIMPQKMSNCAPLSLICEHVFMLWSRHRDWGGGLKPFSTVEM